MRVIDCDHWAQTLCASNEIDLVRAVRAHFETEHGENLDDSQIEQLLADEAYDATDSCTHPRGSTAIGNGGRRPIIDQCAGSPERSSGERLSRG
jgi:hypothetical protein